MKNVNYSKEMVAELCENISTLVEDMFGDPDDEEDAIRTCITVLEAFKILEGFYKKNLEEEYGLEVSSLDDDPEKILQ